MKLLFDVNIELGRFDLTVEKVCFSDLLEAVDTMTANDDEE